MFDLTENTCVQIRELLTVLETRDTEGRIDLFIHQVIEHGGSWAEPSEQPEGWSTHMVEIGLFGISTWGNSTEEAISNWMRAARRAIESDWTFPEPRNSYELLVHNRESLGLLA